MYKISIHLLLFFLCQTSFAQPVLNSSNINPVLGDQYTIYGAVELADTTQIGINVTWDYTTLSPYDSTVIQANSTVGTNIPGASIRFSDPLFQTSDYFNTNPSSLEFAGLDNFSNILIYSDPEKLLRYPFQYNDTLSDYFFYYKVGNSQYRYGTVYSKADGYGTLKLPTGVFSNALRVKTDFHGKDSSNGIATNISYITVRWYVPGIHLPVAEAFLYPAAQATPNFKYLGNITTSTTDLFDNNNIIIYPNPCQDILNIKYEDLQYKKTEKELYNLVGQLLFTTKENEIIVKEYPKGIYYLKVGNMVRKIVVEQ